MKLKVFSIIISLLGVGATGYFLPSGIPSPIRGQIQGRFWGQEKQGVENKYIYQHAYQTPITDFRQIYHHAQSAIPNPQLLQDQQYIYQQEIPYQHEVPYQQATPYQQASPYQQLIQQPIQQPEYQEAPYQYLRNSGPSAPLTAQTTIPVVVRLPNNQAIVVPVRAVYTLPSFLERIVQRFQNYYSVYNPIEQLTLDRPLYTPTVASVSLNETENTTSVPQKKLTTESSETTTKDNSTETTISVTDENSTEETTEQMETTTDPSAFITPDSTPADLQSEGYSYKKPTRSFRFRK